MDLDFPEISKPKGLDWPGLVFHAWKLYKYYEYLLVPAYILVRVPYE